jgi:hypothetical protein
MIEKPRVAVIRDGFLSDWERYIRIVRLFALRRPERYEVDPEKYAQLHKRLLQTCRVPPEREGAEDGSFYRGVEGLLGPWVTLESLAQADDEVVWELLCRCEQVERVLGGRPARDGDWTRLNLLAIGLAGGAAVVLVLVLTWGTDPTTWPVVLSVRHWFRRVSSAVGVSRSVQYLVLGGIIASLAAAWLVCRSARSE